MNWLSNNPNIEHHLKYVRVSIKKFKIGCVKYIELFLILILFYSCTSYKSESRFKSSQDSFIASIKTLSKAIEKEDEILGEALNGHSVDMTPFTELVKVFLKESQSVSNDYLIYLDPRLKELYRTNLVESCEVIVKYLDGDKTNKSANFDSIAEHQKVFWIYLYDNRKTLSKKFDLVDQKNLSFQQRFMNLIRANESKKSYLRMLGRFIISSFFSIFLFAFSTWAVLLILSPILILGSRGQAIAGYLGALLYLIVMVWFIYYWSLWAVYLVNSINFFKSSTDASHFWLYFVTGFIFVGAPVSWLSNKESLMTETYQEYNKKLMGSFIIKTCTITLFIIFNIWPSTLDISIFSWLNEIFY